MSLLEGIKAGMAAMNINTFQIKSFLEEMIKTSFGAVVEPTTSKVTKMFLIVLFVLSSPLLLACALVVP